MNVRYRGGMHSGQKACVGTKGEGRCMGNKFLTSEYSNCKPS